MSLAGSPETQRSSRLADLLWLPVNGLQFLATLAWGAFWISIALVVALVSRRRAPALWLARRIWAPGQIAIGLSRLTVVGRERVDLRHACFFVANHQSWLDIPALFVAVPAPLHFIAKQELARVPFLGWYIAAMGMVFVDRRARRRALASVGQAGELLAAGGCLVSFPEGTRGRPGELGRFKSGGFAAVLDSPGDSPGDSPTRAVDVVPVGIVGTGRILPRGGFKVRPGRIEVRFGAPLSLTGLAVQDRADLARRAETAVAELLDLPRHRRPLATAPVAGATAPQESPV